MYQFDEPSWCRARSTDTFCASEIAPGSRAIGPSESSSLISTIRACLSASLHSFGRRIRFIIRTLYKEMLRKRWYAHGRRWTPIKRSARYTAV